MKRHDTLVPLSRFHRDVLFLALVAKKNAPAVEGYPTTVDGKVEFAVQFYQEKLQPHFKAEAEKLFANMKGKDRKLDNLFTEIAAERERLHELFEQLKTTRQPEQALHQLGVALEQHIRKEERELFQTIQQVLSDEELRAIAF